MDINVRCPVPAHAARRQADDRGQQPGLHHQHLVRRSAQDAALRRAVLPFQDCAGPADQGIRPRTRRVRHPGQRGRARLCRRQHREPADRRPMSNKPPPASRSAAPPARAMPPARYFIYARMRRPTSPEPRSPSTAGIRSARSSSTRPRNTRFNPSGHRQQSGAVNPDVIGQWVARPARSRYASGPTRREVHPNAPLHPLPCRSF